MNKKEVYYKFIFTDYDKLSGTGDSQFGTDAHPIFKENDGDDQIGEVLSLCRSCPERVITYDQLNSPTVQMYSSAWPSSRNSERAALKHYVDQYMSMQKYFDLRNYWDACPCQEGGMSLLVSSSPEIGGNINGFWDKFQSTYDNKYVYCSLVVSSGDFFYGFNLPENILAKSNLRDTIVTSKFHDNWYLKYTNNGLSDPNDEKSHYYYYTCTIGHPLNPAAGAEKRVFVPHYCLHGTVVPLGKVYDDNDNLIDLHYQESDPEYSSTDKRKYTNQYLTRNFIPCDTGDTIGLPYGINNVVQTGYSTISEDLKRDFIDLEVTRRILYYCSDHSNCLKYPNGSSYTHKTIGESVVIPVSWSGFGKNTAMSYEPPQEYIDKPPLQIPYNLLRYSLNDRPPFTDCETVLVIWVANNASAGDPDNVSAGDVAALHNLDWQQYAIPISIRCCYKNPSSYCFDRFLVSYPHSKTSSSDDEYRWHIRCSEQHIKDDNTRNEFKDALYLRDLMTYSNDYIIAYQHRNHYNIGFDIQKYLFKTCSSDFRELYVRKTYTTIHRQQQFYYVRVDKLKYNYGINKNNSSICVVDGDSESTAVFSPNAKLLSSDFSQWDFDNWSIDDNWFIALFNINSSMEPVSGNIGFTNASSLRTLLRSVYHNIDDTTTGYNTWDDLYISSLGVTPNKQINIESQYCGYTSSYSDRCLPLGILENYIKIGSTTYGRNAHPSHKVLIGLKNVYDYDYEDKYHFRYNYTLNEYEPVNGNYSCNAYIMQYTS